MSGRIAVALLVILAAAWASPAGAFELIGGGPSGPPMGQTTSGFVEVIGPSGDEPEHAGQFRAPPPSLVCKSCESASNPPDQVISARPQH